MAVTIPYANAGSWLGEGSFPTGLLSTDVLVYANICPGTYTQTVTSVSGAGATWTAATATTGSYVVWIGTNPSAGGGSVTISPDPPTPMSFGGSYAATWVIRGLTSAATSNIGFVTGATPASTPTLSLSVGQVMLASGLLRGGSASEMPTSASLPSSGAWTRNTSLETAQIVVTSNGNHKLVAANDGADPVIGYMVIGTEEVYVPNPQTGSRLYMPHGTAAPTSPAFSTTWTSTTGADRHFLSHKPDEQVSTSQTQGVSETSATNPTYGIADQFVSAALPANKTISGSFAFAGPARSGGAGGVYARVVARVVDGTTGVEKAVLFDGASTTQVSSSGSYENKIISGAITPYAAVAGDRIVIERGGTFTNTTATSASITYGRNANIVGSDAPYTADTAGLGSRAWVEFSQPDIWGPPMAYLAGENTQTLEAPSRTPTQMAGVSATMVAYAPRTPTHLAGMAVQALIPRAGQAVDTIKAKGSGIQIKTRRPNGTWAGVWPVKRAASFSGDSATTSGKTPTHLGSWVASTGSAVSTGALDILPTDMFILTYVSGWSGQARNITAGPTAIPGLTWTQVVAGTTDGGPVQRAWIGTGATSFSGGSVGVTLSGSDTNAATYLSVWRGPTTFVASDIKSRAGNSFTLNPGVTLTRKRVAHMVSAAGGTNTATGLNPSAAWNQAAFSTARYGFAISPLSDAAGNVTMTVNSPNAISISGIMVVVE